VLAFRQEHGIERGGPAPLAPITPDSVVEAMLAEEAAALEAGPEPEEPALELEAAAKPAPKRRTRQRAAAAEPEEADASGEDAPAAAEAPADAPVSEDAPAKSSRRRGARGGAGRNKPAAVAAEEPEEPAELAADLPASAVDTEAPGEDDPARNVRKRRRRGRGRGASRGLEARLLPGSVLLLDPSVTADATFQEHWAEAGPLRVEVSSDAIVLRRVAEAAPDGASN
jgi:hypothetical protein